MTAEGGSLARIRRSFGTVFGRGRGLGFLILLLAIGLRILEPVAVQVAQMRGFDLLQILLPRERAADAPIAIAAIDEASLASVGQWPWPRTRLAELTEKLHARGAVVVGFDILFAEPDRTSPASIAESIPQLDPATRQQLAALPDNDQVFAGAFADCCVVIGRAIGEADGSAATDPPPNTPSAAIGTDPLTFATGTGRRLIAPVRALDDAAQGHGILDLPPEPDGIVRRAPVVSAVAGTLQPALAVEMIRLAVGEQVFVTRATPSGFEGVLVGGVLIPTDPGGRAWIRFGPAGDKAWADRIVSADAVLRDAPEADIVAGKLVLVGTTGAGLQNLKATPMAAATAGITVQAELLEALIGGAFLTRPDWMLALEAAVIAAIGLLMLWLVPAAGGRRTLIVVAVILGALAATSGILFTRAGLLFDYVLPFVTVAALYGSLVYANYAQAENQRRQIRDTFSRYLAPDLVEQLAREPDRAALGGERRTMSFLFTDIRGFTGISEQFKADPSGLTRLINRFMTPMTEAILKRNGTIDKYIGDCIMAFWNAPLANPNHPRNACLAALDMLARLADLNAALTQEAEGSAAGAAPVRHGDYTLAKAIAEGEEQAGGAVRAFALFKREAEQGFANAQYNLAKAYRDGYGVEADLEEAARWFLAAAKQGHAKAQARAGTRYLNGEGVVRDEVEALAWLTLAARHGMEEVEPARRALLAQLSTAQVEEAETRAQFLEERPTGGAIRRLDIGIGINTGDCIVGNMGSDMRFDYSVLGDAVNLAARLEAQSKSYGVAVVVGEETQKSAPDLAFLELDRIAVKGKTEATRIFALLGDDKRAADPAFQDFLARHGNMLAAYRSQNWAAARSLAVSCRAEAPELDDLYDLYLDRIEHFEANPPGPNWRGIYFAATK